MEVKLYDTLTRSIRPLAPQAGKPLGFYVCGPTVYGPAHIGNFRTFVNCDVLRRVLEVAGYNVRKIRNITDVDDKTIRQSQEVGQPLGAFTRKWTETFHADCAALNLLSPHEEPKATDHIGEMITLVEKLIENGHAYVTEDRSVYFRIKSKADYGKLSHFDLEQLQTQATTSSGQRNTADEYARDHISDFALWKARKPEDGDNFWPSPWGEGRPGWHLECSAMSMHYLGETFDLHGGGVDLCFPHHENEIAQSEAATGQPFVRHWFHAAFLVVEGHKMSKSLGNFWTLADVTEMGFSPMVLRYGLLAGHYRQQLNLTKNGLQAAASALAKMERAVLPLLDACKLSKEDFRALIRPTRQATTGVFEGAWNALAEDLNVPAALGEIFTALKHLGDDTDFHSLAVKGQVEAFGGILYALGLELFSTPEAAKSEAPEAVVELAEQRWQAKQAKDFAEADRLRETLNEQGWKVVDRKDGYALEQV
ncbi:MAG: cysteine--tRNA ligase [Opitutales bacterium]